MASGGGYRKPYVISRPARSTPAQGVLLVVLIEMSVDAAPGKPVQDNATQEFGIRVLHFLRLQRDISGQPHTQLHGTRFPHARCVARAHWVTRCTLRKAFIG